MRRIHLVWVGFLLLLGGAAWFAWDLYTRSPGYSLKKLSEAIEAHDRGRFETYVDVESFVSHTVDDAFDAAMADAMEELSDQSGMEALGAAFGAALVNQMKPALKASGKQLLLEAVETGSLGDAVAEVEAAGESQELDIAEAGASVGLSLSTFAGFGDLEEESGVATQPVLFRLPVLDTTLSVSLRLEQRGQRWVVTRPLDLDAYLRTVRDLQDARLASVNDSIDSVLANAIEVSSVIVDTEPRTRYSDDLVVRVFFENTSSDTVSEARFQLIQPGSVAVALDRIDIRWSPDAGRVVNGDVTFLTDHGNGYRTLPSGAGAGVYVRQPLNPFIAWQQELVQATEDIDNYLNDPERARPYYVDFTSTKAPLRRFDAWEDYVASLSSPD